MTDVGDRITPTGMPSGSGRVADATAPVGPRGTMRLAVHVPPAPPPSVRGNIGDLPTNSPRPAATIVDDGTVDDPYDAEPASELHANPPSRARRVVIGVVLALTGAAVFTVSITQLFFDDEAPPPLVESPRTPSSPTASASAR